MSLIRANPHQVLGIKSNPWGPRHKGSRDRLFFLGSNVLVKMAMKIYPDKVDFRDSRWNHCFILFSYDPVRDGYYVLLKEEVIHGG